MQLKLSCPDFFSDKTYHSLSTHYALRHENPCQSQVHRCVLWRVTPKQLVDETDKTMEEWSVCVCACVCVCVCVCVFVCVCVCA